MSNVLLTLNAEHQEALEWFNAHTGLEIAWPARLGKVFLLNKAKGIHKPAGWKHALSIRQSINSPYTDSDPIMLEDGGWTYRYFQEGKDPLTRDKDFTNKALMHNIADRVPVAVVRQVKGAPDARYKVLGLAQAVDWNNGYFEFRNYVPDTFGDVSMVTPVNLEDARRRINRAIITRQGSGPFRTAALAAFDRRCAVSGYDVEQGLEAAHIVPYLGRHTNALHNTLLLRADLHTLFDRGLLDIDPETLRVSLASSIKQSCLNDLDGKEVILPGPPAPWQDNLRQRVRFFINKGI